MTINPGANIESDFGYQHEVTASWSFNPDSTMIYMQIPFFYDANWTSYSSEVELCKITKLSQQELGLEFTFNDDESKGTYTFSLIYKHPN